MSGDRNSNLRSGIAIALAKRFSNDTPGALVQIMEWLSRNKSSDRYIDEMLNRIEDEFRFDHEVEA